MDINQEIEKLKSEASMHLHSLFRIPSDCHSSAIDRVVECIVSAAILQVAALNQQMVDEIKKG